jgi:hypothetical protein
MTKSLDEVVLQCVGTDEFCHRHMRSKTESRHSAMACASRACWSKLIGTKATTRRDLIAFWDLYESGEEIRGKVTKVEQFVANGGMHIPNETQDQRAARTRNDVRKQQRLGIRARSAVRCIAWLDCYSPCSTRRILPSDLAISMRFGGMDPSTVHTPSLSVAR